MLTYTINGIQYQSNHVTGEQTRVAKFTPAYANLVRYARACNVDIESMRKCFVNDPSAEAQYWAWKEKQVR